LIQLSHVLKAIRILINRLGLKCHFKIVFEAICCREVAAASLGSRVVYQCANLFRKAGSVLLELRKLIRVVAETTRAIIVVVQGLAEVVNLGLLLAVHAGGRVNFIDLQHIIKVLSKSDRVGSRRTSGGKLTLYFRLELPIQS